MPTPIRPLLWKLRDRPVHFLGSIHMGPTGGFEIPDAALHPFDAADQVYFEIADVDGPPSAAFLARERGSLRDDLRASLYARLEAHEDYEPWFETLKLEAVTIVLGARLYPRMGYTPEFGIEVALCRRLIAQGRPRRGLETRQEQEVALLTTTVCANYQIIDTKNEDNWVTLQSTKECYRGNERDSGEEAGPRTADRAEAA